MGRRLLMLGPPGVGKGTQAGLLSRAIGVPHISTGAMLRAAVEAGTDLGKRAQEIMERGDLVPDDLVTAMVIERLSEDDAACGYVLDGYPRNPAQADALVEALGPDCIELAFAIDAPERELVARLQGRAQEESRSDDSEEVIVNRLRVYNEETAPLIDYYTAAGRISHVDGLGPVLEVFGRLVEGLAT